MKARPLPPSHHHPPHPPHGHPPAKKARRRSGIPASRALAFVDEGRLDGWLAPLVPDAGDRAFVVRCLVGEGPIHHRGANYVLLALLARALQAHGGVQPRPEGERVAMRLPPHLAETVDEGNYPLTLPTEALLALAGGDAQQLEAMIDCLTDGPPQHALANVAMVALIEGLLTTKAETP